jgi:NAD(P)-dependent dehydrogenase (short-subunit alcohol dehydrogenase family)
LTENFTVNAIAPIAIAQRFAALLPEGRTGAVINILDNRVFAPNPDYFSYGISKFAALGATRMLALALAPRIRVNGIAPGITLPSGAQTHEQYEVASRLNPLGRACSAEEIAAAVRLIAGSPAMTGAVITIDGGLALANPGRDVAFIEPGTA